MFGNHPTTDHQQNKQGYPLILPKNASRKVPGHMYLLILQASIVLSSEETRLWVHQLSHTVFFNFQIFFVLHSTGGRKNTSLPIEFPCKKAVLKSMECNVHSCVAIILNVAQTLFRIHVGLSVLKAADSSKPLAHNLAFIFCFPSIILGVTTQRTDIQS